MTTEHKKRNGFTMVRNDILSARDLTPLDKLVLVALLSFDWQAKDGARKGKVWPGQRTIADTCGVSRRSIRVALARLRETGYVEFDSTRGRGHIAEYTFTDKALIPAKERSNGDD
jgi:biotin operon repressor